MKILLAPQRLKLEDNEIFIKNIRLLRGKSIRLGFKRVIRCFIWSL